MKLSRVFKLFNIDWTLFITHFEAFSNYQHCKFKALSVGERRLVETYIILKTESQIVILDEQFSHLSPICIERVKQLISEEKEYKAVMISDHMYQHIIDSADTIYLLQNGTTKKIENLKRLEGYAYISEGMLPN